MRTHRWLGWGLLVLGAVIAASALLGPFVAGVIRYHTSDTTLNQIIGGDAARCCSSHRCACSSACWRGGGIRPRPTSDPKHGFKLTEAPPGRQCLPPQLGWANRPN